MWRLVYWLRVHWYRLDKEPLAVLGIAGAVLAALGLAMQSVFALQDERRAREREFHARHVACLAKNVYFEARGEPLAGQYAVAEVTMNRKASGLYPATVCEVVYQQNWDPLRGRYVGAFSWTEFSVLPLPDGDDWKRAQRIAEEVYYQKHPPLVDGALFFHATWMKPDWARERKPVSRIGRHVFYK